MLMDSTASAVIVALNTLKTQFGDIRSISFDPGTNFTPMTRFSDDSVHDDDGNENSLDEIKEFASANGIQTFISPPKASFYQGIAEKYIDKIKTLMFLQPQRSLHILELQCVLKQMEYMVNARPVSMDEDGCILTRLHLLGHRTKSGVDTELFNQPVPMAHAGRFQDHVEAMEELVDTFWIKFKDLLLEDFLKIQAHRFPGQIEPKIGDICAIPDKCLKSGGMAVGEVVAIKPNVDGEARVCIVEVARKKRRSHPYPLAKATHRMRKYERHIHNLIFLLRPIRDHEFKQTGRSFLYENLIGGIDGIDDQIDDENEDTEDDDNTRSLRNQRDLRDLLQLTRTLRDHSDDDADDSDGNQSDNSEYDE